MSRFWNARLRELEPYVPGEQPRLPDLVKLNTNENPHGPSPRVIDAIRAAADDGLRLYPDPEAEALRGTIADYHGLGADQVFLGNGSDEVLAFIFQGFFRADEPVLFPDITYSFYPVYCRLYGLEGKTCPLDEEFRIDPDAFRPPNGGVIFPNPNAPTGVFLPLEGVEAILAANPDRVVVVDEAYVDFGGDSASCLIDRYPNLLVTQTLSKSRSLAGLRVGVALGRADLISGLDRIKNSFNSYPLDRLAQAGAIAAFEDDAYFQRCRRSVIDERGFLTESLESLGFEVLPSAANFILCRHPGFTGAYLAGQLREQGIIVRHFDRPRIRDFLRITVGTREQTSALVRALGGLVGSST